jgi:hypothetical protein
MKAEHPTPAIDIVELPTELDKRELIKVAVDAAANGVMENIKSLRGQLDELESLVIQNAARVTENLNTHVGICEAAQIEVNRLSGIVADMRRSQIDNISERTGQLNGGRA